MSWRHRMFLPMIFSTFAKYAPSAAPTQAGTDPGQLPESSRNGVRVDFPRSADALLGARVDVFGQQRPFEQRRGLGEGRGGLRLIRREIDGKARQYALPCGP